MSCSIHTSASRNRNAKLRHRCCRNNVWALLSTASKCNSTSRVEILVRISRKGKKIGARDFRFISLENEINESRNSRCSLSCVPLGPRKRRTVEVRVKRWWALRERLTLKIVLDRFKNRPPATHAHTDVHSLVYT